MLTYKRMALFFSMALLLGLISACGGVAPESETTAAAESLGISEVEVRDNVVKAENSQISLRTAVGTEPPTLDPALVTDTASNFFVHQMFVGLTKLDQNSNAVPELAKEWQVSDDGLTWVFALRDDINWVHRDPTTGVVEVIRPVDASDVVYGISRALNPETASDFAYVLYPIAGAEELNGADPNDENFQTLISDLGVQALDETTVEFTLKEPAAYFPSLMALSTAFPQPQEAVDRWGDNWIEAGLIVTNGPYTLREWIHGASIMLEKNPFWIDADNVQIELFGGPIIEEASTAMAMYENNELDMLADPGWGPPLPDMDRIQADPQLSQELFMAPRTCTYYYGFINSNPPFDDPAVRKAFSAAIDRESLITNVLKGGQTPAHSFAPPGIFGNVADDTQIGSYLVAEEYSDRVAEAQTLLAEAGYPNGEGIDIVLGHNSGEIHALIAQATQAMWQEAFPEALITIEGQEWPVFLSSLNPEGPDEEKPDVFRGGWCADYPDSNNWLNEVFNSKSGANFAKFHNAEYDALVEQAAFESEPSTRLTLYRQAEEILIDQAAAIAPVYYYSYVRMYKPWIKPVISPAGGDPVAEWQIDLNEQQAASD